MQQALLHVYWCPLVSQSGLRLEMLRCGREVVLDQVIMNVQLESGHELRYFHIRTPAQDSQAIGIWPTWAGHLLRPAADPRHAILLSVRSRVRRAPGLLRWHMLWCRR